MKTKKVGFLIISMLILISDIAMSFILNAYSAEPARPDARALYLVSKCVAVLSFTVIIALYFVKRDHANYLIQYIGSVIFQFVPLIIRYLSLTRPGFVASVVILFVALLIYCGLICGLQILSVKTAKAAKELEGERLPVKQEKDDEETL